VVLKPRTWSKRARYSSLVVGGAALAVVAGTGAVWAQSPAKTVAPAHHKIVTATPIKHIVVIFDENVSFDHYFGTYPKAANTDGTPFTAGKHTPKINGLSPALLTANPNEYNPSRLTHEQAMTCDQNHGYGAEQLADDNGLVDQFVQHTETSVCTGQPILFGQPGLVMDYYDGNTVTGLWNYAQHYAMSDNSFDTSYGPSSPGAINLISGQTHGVLAVDPVTHQPVTSAYTSVSPDASGIGTVINDPDPAWDDCSDKNHTSANALAAMQGKNVGDLLNQRGVTWGWFQGGFKPTGTANGYAVCGATHTNLAGATVVDYSPHHSPFEYYQSTANPHHLPPSSVAQIGYTDQANHNYDLSDFNDALAADNLPAVSFVKAPEYQDGHAGYSDPLDEQTFLVNTINALEKSPEWSSTAVVISYDDSDGWYDHVAPKTFNGSADPVNDQPGVCGTNTAAGGYADRCGYGPRLPLLVISPYAKTNFVDHTLTDQVSVLTFIEQNWFTGHIGDYSFDTSTAPITNMFDFWSKPNKKPVVLDPTTGAVVS
jgi:phospholipase C